MSDSVEAAIQRAAAGAAATEPATPLVIKEDRSIVVPTAMQQIAVQCDNKANVLHFVCPRNWADIDLAAATLYINVVKPDKSIVAFTCTNVASSEATVTFDWVITEYITEVAGKLSFLVCARDPSDPGDGYRWHSNLCNSLFVAPGIACTVPNILPDPPHIPLYGTDTTLTEPGVPADAAAVGVQLSSLSNKVANLPQADWNQNDKTAADYVKNRPFYTGAPVETVLVEESTATFEADSNGLYIADFPPTFVATVGETYKISWDGTVYECACVALGPGCALGNLSIIGAGSDTGEPFVMAIMNGEAIQIGTADTSASHTFSISRTVVPVVKIDKKYLVQPDWNQNDSTAADYVKNRTHYEESSYTDYVLNMDGPELVGFSMPEVGETVTVKINGVESTETVKATRSGALGDYTYIGTIDFDSLRKGRTGWCVAAIPGQALGFANPDTTMSVGTTVIHKIDEKYLPDTLLSFKPAGKSYLTFSSLISFTLKVNDSTKHWNGTLEYFAPDKTWTVWDGTTTLSAVSDDGEYVLYLRGTGNTVITGTSSNYKWILTGSNIKCIGNIETLLDYATVESGNHPTMATYCYADMFNGCTSLTQAPALPATTLATYCYASMFRGCTGLTQAPALPATTLASGCYSSMFRGCTGLTQAPALPATTLANNCYLNMFNGCTGLTQAPALPATALADHCYGSMFNGCTGLTQAPALPATTLTNYCYSSMFRGCTGLKLSPIQTGEYTQEYRIPTTGTGTVATDALVDMFAYTGGSFTGTPTINTTYYLSSDNMIVRETEIATLKGYVGAMIDAHSVILPSSTEGSTKKFKITVDDSGTISAVAV